MSEQEEYIITRIFCPISFSHTIIISCLWSQHIRCHFRHHHTRMTSRCLLIIIVVLLLHDKAMHCLGSLHFMMNLVFFNLAVFILSMARIPVEHGSCSFSFLKVSASELMNYPHPGLPRQHPSVKELCTTRPRHVYSAVSPKDVNGIYSQVSIYRITASEGYICNA